jgi:protein required for attachment to host cells
MAIEKSKICMFVIDGKQALFYNKPKDENLIKLQHKFESTADRSDHHTTHSLGRAFDSAGSARHAIEPHIDERVKEKQDFISEVMGYLEKLFADHQYKHLVIIAPPKVLGFIRNHISKQLKEMLVLEIDKDFTHEPAEHIQKEVFTKLRLA